MDKSLATTFLQVIFGRVPGDQWVSCFAIDRTANQSARAAQKVLWSRVDEIPELVERLAPLSPDHCIWYGVSSRRSKLESGRGGTNDCALVPCLWADLDVTGPGHKSENLPPTEADALSLLASFPEPSFVVRTGGGLQPYWMLDEPWPVEEALPILDRWYYTWKELCDERGWHIDNVFDPARILRLPSTTNNKDLSAPLPVTMLPMAPVV